MEKKRTYIELIPSAQRLIESLRDMGYDFVKAVADIIDNSIQATATEIRIDLHFDGTYSWVRISDNGHGMSKDELTEAMRFGTKRSYGSKELGKFGLGMKTASISQCRRLTVASRLEGVDSIIEVRRLDLDEIEKSDKWEVTDLPSDQCSPNIIIPLNEHRGTVVYWEFLDRMMKYKISSGEAARKGFSKMAGPLERHISMVFHRFLNGEIQGREKVCIYLNDRQIEPWDPFARAEHSTPLEPKKILLHDSSGTYEITCSPFILPPQSKFSSIKAFNYYAGVKRWNLQQGFYIYRENRMIQSGGWNDIRTSEEHTKLARVALDFNSDMDSLLNVDIKKANIILPEELVDALDPIVSNVTSLADRVYRSAAREMAQGAGSNKQNTVRKVESGPASVNGREGEPQTKGVLEGSSEASQVNTSPNDIGSIGKNNSIDESNIEHSVPFVAGLDPTINRLIEMIENGTAPPEIFKDFLKGVIGNTIRQTMEAIGKQEIYSKVKQRLRLTSPKIADLLGW